MSALHSEVRANAHVFLRIPKERKSLFIHVEVKPDTILDIGKIPPFPSNLLLGRPYYNTYETLEKQEGEAYPRLRIVPPEEVNAEVITADLAPSEVKEETNSPTTNGYANEHDLLLANAETLTKDNRFTVDDASTQRWSQLEIEEFKKVEMPKEIIHKIVDGHATIEEKTDYAKIKYMRRKQEKYLKQFTVLPMDIGNLMRFVLDKEPPRIMELREEVLGLIMASSNVHFSPSDDKDSSEDDKRIGSGRWLVCDETGGLVVAAMAERMGILYSDIEQEANTADTEPIGKSLTNGGSIANSMATSNGAAVTNGNHESGRTHQSRSPTPDWEAVGVALPTDAVKANPHTDFPIPAISNTLTLLHPAVQPNLSLLKYFGYDTNNPSPSHPLHTRLKPLSWLQLLHPDEDPTYKEPEIVSLDELQTWKSGKRGMYWKKRRRWERCKAIVDDTRAGEFEGVVVASSMDPATILKHAIPLIRGGGTVTVYSPTVEPLTGLVDLYSKERKTAYINYVSKGMSPATHPDIATDFPVDPRLLLAPTLQTTKARQWQVLPGRSHPVMTDRGGAEGYIFTARRVIPLEGGVEARGNFAGRKRKADAILANGADGHPEMTRQP